MPADLKHVAFAEITARLCRGEVVRPEEVIERYEIADRTWRKWRLDYESLPLAEDVVVSSDGSLRMRVGRVVDAALAVGFRLSQGLVLDSTKLAREYDLTSEEIETLKASLITEIENVIVGTRGEILLRPEAKGRKYEKIELDHDRVTKLYLEHGTVKLTADALGVSVPVARRHLREAGVDVSGGRGRKRIELDHEEVANLYREFESVNTVATKMGTSPSVIQRHLDEAGVETERRPRSRRSATRQSVSASEAFASYMEHGTIAAAGVSLGVSRETVRKRLQDYATAHSLDLKDVYSKAKKAKQAPTKPPQAPTD